LHEVDYPSSIERYKHFARCILEGHVLADLLPFQPFLANKPILLTKKWNPTKVNETIQPLISYQIDSKKKLLQKWCDAFVFLF